MPGIVLHSLLATRVLDAWQGSPSAPFDAGDSLLRNAFLSGAMGPDMGLFPGGERFISDLVHYVRSGELARQLVRQAGTPLETAYAWGWLTHVLGDVGIHPLINRGVGELLHGDRNRATPYDEDPVAHVQLELAIDGDCYCRRWTAPPARLRPVFDAQTIDFLVRSFAATYGPGVVRAASLLKTHEACTRYSRYSWSVSAVIGNRLRGRAVPAGQRSFYWLVYLPVKLAASLAARRRPVYGVTHPIMPAAWLFDELEAAIGEFSPRFFALVDARLENFPDYNLDLGEVEASQPGYGPTLATLAALDERRARPETTSVRAAS